MPIQDALGVGSPRDARARECGELEALSARIEVSPGTEVEGEDAEGRADTGVEVDFSRSAVRERDARTGDTGVELQVLGDVVARLEVDPDRGLWFDWVMPRKM